MSNVNQTYVDRVNYVLSAEHDGWNPLPNIDPIGWQNDDKELARNADYHGIFPSFSNNLQFDDEAKDYINSVRALLGINAQLRLTKFERHPQTDKWFRTYWGYLDLSEWKQKDDKVSVKFNSGGLEQLIKSRESEDIEIDRPDTMDGLPLTSLNIETVALDGRRIFLKSKWEADNTSNPIRIRVYSADGNTRYSACALPLELTSRSHEQAQSTIPSMGGPGDSGNTGRQILALFDRPRTIRVYANQLKFKPIVYPKNVGWAFLKVCVSVYENGINYDLKERRVLFHAGHLSAALPNVFAISGQTFALDINETINVVAGDSIAIEFYIGSDLGPDVDFLADISEFEGFAYAEEDSFFEPSQSKFVLIHDMLDRIAEVCTSKKKSFYSKYFGRTDLGYAVNGPGSAIGATHGFWIRQFDKLPLPTDAVPNLFKPITTSYKEALSSCIAVLNVGMGIEEINGRERIRVEDLKYFYNNNVLIKLPNQIQNVERSEAKEYYNSAIEIGYEKGGDYEEAQGLDEPNGTTNFTTVITRISRRFSQLSKFRSDSYGKEFCRRKPISQDETLDTQYDTDKWFLDLKKGLGTIYEERKWQDDFDVQPTGIFAPDTATNLRFSPFNMLLRHGWFLNAGFYSYMSDYVRYGSSTANSNLKTKLIGKPEYAENGNIINSELERPRFIPEWIDFEHECDFHVMRQVFGTTTINGEELPNYYGLVEFTNENNEIEKGFLFNLKPNGNGKWRILKSNR